jgi:asparagine synthase (glutamine-hydrolysing)
MCGLAGYLGCGGTGAETLERMAEAIRSRGPDDVGVWHDAGAAVGLAHRRLAIVDLSPAGHQPMDSPSGRHVIVFNGEIYNHADLRAELEREGRAPAWRGRSDTETLLAGFDAWGIEGTVRRLLGMFAFAVWDRAERALTLGRDRLGEKPLYYGWFGGERDCLLFGSEVKAMRAHPRFSAEIDRDALCLLLRHNYIPAPYSIYRDVRKLPPGCLLTVADGRPGAEPRAYWSLAEVAQAGCHDSLHGSPEEMVDELEILLKDAVGRQMMADVPLGAFLSGGVDSSTIVALMREHTSHPVRTFTIGFDDARDDEAAHAGAVAAHLGTDHTELRVTPEQAMAVIPRLPAMYDEPFADSSQIPTFLVSELARRHVTVALSGDAGDELFCGYRRYLSAASLWRGLAPVPASLRGAIGRGILAIPPASWDRVAVVAGRPGRLGDKLHKGGELLGSRSLDELHLGLASFWRDPAAVVRGGAEPPTKLSGAVPDLSGLGPIERMMALDTVSYLPDDILAKVDRAAMSVSLETRVPFLDHRVVEFAWRLPLAMKLREGQGKWALRQVLHRYVPRSLIERPKMGFGVPLDSWLRGPLRGWAEETLSEARLRSDGYFDPRPIRAAWSEHLSGRRNRSHHLWGVLMFNTWLAAGV